MPSGISTTAQFPETGVPTFWNTNECMTSWFLIKQTTKRLFRTSQQVPSRSNNIDVCLSYHWNNHTHVATESPRCHLLRKWARFFAKTIVQICSQSSCMHNVIYVRSSRSGSPPWEQPFDFWENAYVILPLLVTASTMVSSS